MKHRVAIVGTWLAITIALVAFPGFETRGLAMGLAIGYWPFVLLAPMLGDVVHQHPIVVYLGMFLLSAAEVGAGAWMMDAARLSKRAWTVVLLAVAFGALAVHAAYPYGFEDWRSTPAVSAAMESPELNYEPTRWDFYKASVIPKTLAGGLLGLYAAVLVGFVCSGTLIALRRRRLPVASHA
jgi:hypothetical protein